MSVQKIETYQDMPFAVGYGTNGWADHPLPVAIPLLAEQGYTAIALTLGHPHIDPFAQDLTSQLAEIRTLLERYQMRVVVETGTRFLLDPKRKHRPTLVDQEAEARMNFLRRAIDIARALDAECVSFFSGVIPEGTKSSEGWDLLVKRLADLVIYAAEREVRLSLEPEPGMLVETVADALRLRSELGDPDALGITVDIGHCVVVEPGGVQGALQQAGALLANVQLDDMLAHAHEHLPFGQGIVDLPQALSTLAEMNYQGVAAVELPRHSWDAPALAESSLRAISQAWSEAKTQSAHGRWLSDALAAIANDPRCLPQIFALAGRTVARTPINAQADPTGVIFGMRVDHARADLIAKLFTVQDPEALAQHLRDLYYRGDSAERRGVLRGLNKLVDSGRQLEDRMINTGLEITGDALRTNETSLVAAAVGAFGAAHLDQHAWRHAVLKLVFMGVSLRAVQDLHVRADEELARMAKDFAAERRAANRSIPEDVALLTELPIYSERSDEG